MTTKRWTWADATPRERGDWVRRHLAIVKNDPKVHRKALCELFNLTEEGCTRILAGDHWRPKYQAKGR